MPLWSYFFCGVEPPWIRAGRYQHLCHHSQKLTNWLWHGTSSMMLATILTYLCWMTWKPTSTHPRIISAIFIWQVVQGFHKIPQWMCHPMWGRYDVPSKLDGSKLAATSVYNYSCTFRGMPWTNMSSLVGCNREYRDISRTSMTY